jgi:hypothetical protein
MSFSMPITTEETKDTFSKALLSNDLSVLKTAEKVFYLNEVCKSLNLNPLTKPIQLISFKGKEIPYFTKEATEQLRKIRKVSITGMEQKMLDGGIYVVTVHACTRDGRTDASTGAINVNGLKGDDLCNAMLKAETKAKRRVTLSICGLGFIDESEAYSIPGAKKINIEISDALPKEEVKLIENIPNQEEIDNSIEEIYQCASLNDLQDKFNSHKKLNLFRNNKELLDLLISAKDKQKSKLVEEGVKEFNEEIDSVTGEVK